MKGIGLDLIRQVSAILGDEHLRQQPSPQPDLPE